MKRTYTNEQKEMFEVSGKELRIYWDETEEVIEDILGEDVPHNMYSYKSVVVNVFAPRNVIIEQVIRFTYPTYGAEVAAIQNGGADLEQHQAIRLEAKEIANQWELSNLNPNNI